MEAEWYRTAIDVIAKLQPVCRTWPFLQETLHNYAFLIDQESKRKKLHKLARPIISNVTITVAALIVLGNYDPLHPRRPGFPPLDVSLKLQIANLQTHIAASAAFIQSLYMEFDLGIFERRRTEKIYARIEAEKYDAFRDAIQTRLLRYVEFELERTRPESWWPAMFNEPQALRGLLRYFRARGIQENRASDIELEQVVADFRRELQQSGHVPRPIAETSLTAAQFAREAVALLRIHFTEQFDDVCNELELSTEEQMLRSCRDNTRLLTRVVGRIVNSQTLRSRAAELRNREAERFLDILQLVMDAKNKWSPSLHSQAREILDRMRYLYVKVGRESRALPAKLYVNGVQLASFNPVRFGGFASIYRGTLEGKVVALKRLRANLSGHLEWVFYQEALIWSRMRHPYVLAFLGMDKDVLESPCIVLPWCERGSVIDWVSSLPINTVNLIDLICKISSGLAYLHSQSIVHGDLRGGNVLVDNDQQPRLADLGLANFADPNASDYKVAGHGNTRWLAPELLQNDGADRSRESDIWSLGCVMLELYTQRAPYLEIDSEYRVTIRISEGYKPLRPTPAQCGGAIYPDTLWALTEQCLAPIASQRPHADMISRQVALLV